AAEVLAAARTGADPRLPAPRRGVAGRPAAAGLRAAPAAGGARGAPPVAHVSAARLAPRSALALGLVLLGLAFVAGSASGAYPIAPAELLQMLAGGGAGGAQPSPAQ